MNTGIPEVFFSARESAAGERAVESVAILPIIPLEALSTGAGGVGACLAGGGVDAIEGFWKR